MTELFDHKSFTTRNFGFVTKDEQANLRAASIFVAGVGRMGGACALALARAGGRPSRFREHRRFRDRPLVSHAMMAST
jgi:hypothetical protein